MSMQSAWRRQRAKDQETVERYAQEIMTDKRWDWLRSLRARRAIVVALVVMLTATVALYTTAGSWGFVAVAASFLVWVALRLAVRTVADLPDELLDERQIALRNRAYRSSFLSLSGVLIVGVGASFVWVLATTRNGASAQLAISDNDVLGVFWAVTGLCLALPSMTIAWTETAT